MGKISNRDMLFAQEYLIDLNPERAALAVGYSKTMARTKAYAWVSNSKQKPLLFEYIQKLMDKRAKRLEITAEKVLQEIAKSAFANMQDYITVTKDGYAYVDLSKLTKDQAAAIQEITTDTYHESNYDDLDKKGKPKQRAVKKVKFKLTDKKASLELLGKHLKLFVEVNEETKIEKHLHFVKINTEDLKDKDRRSLIDIVTGRGK